MDKTNKHFTISIDLPPHFETWLDFYYTIIKETKECGGIIGNEDNIRYAYTHINEPRALFYEISFGLLKRNAFDELMTLINDLPTVSDVYEIRHDLLGIFCVHDKTLITTNKIINFLDKTRRK